MNRAVKNGDTVNIDYVGSIGGVEFENGSTGGNGTDVTIGTTQYIDNFLEQLIGHKPGETVNVRVTFPKDYGEATLQGKSALFVTTINYIAETAVPELTDAFVAENLASYNGWKTVKEMKDDIRANLQKAAIEHFITEYFTSKITIKSVPEKLVEYRQKLNLYYLRNQVESYGMGFDDALNTMGFSSIDEYFEANYDSIKNEAVIFLVFQAIAEDAGISINSKDIEEYFAKYYGLTDYSYYEESFGLPYVKLNVMYQKVLDYVIENAVRL
jgi:trigger factor